MALESQGDSGQHSTSDAGQGAQESGAGGRQSTENASEGGDFDFQSFLQSHRQEMESVRSELGKKDGELKKTSKVIDSLRQALTGEDVAPKKKDRYESEVEDAQTQLDKIIEIALEAERSGRPMPLTASLGVQLQKFRIDSLNKQKQFMQVIGELQEKVERMSDPGNQADAQIFASMDTALEGALDQIYGPEDQRTKAVMFRAVTDSIVADIKDLKKSDPNAWREIRRKPDLQRKLVNYHLKQTIPPKARQIMEEDNVRKTPLTGNELIAAWREAKELGKSDPRAARYAEEIRQQILAEKFGKSFSGGSAQMRMNE